MSTFLFGSVVFGPVKSRRFGVSLGMNITPAACKMCSYDCIYCECGWTEAMGDNEFPKREHIKQELSHWLQEHNNESELPDAITFAGNGEPTLHPEFEAIINDTIELRNLYCPDADVVVLTNSSMLSKTSVFNALQCVDKAVLKLDTLNEVQYKLMNRPFGPQSANDIASNLIKFGPKAIVQTLMMRAELPGGIIDNTSDEELIALSNVVQSVGATAWMIYPVDRDTPDGNIRKLERSEMDRIGAFLKEICQVPIQIFY